MKKKEFPFFYGAIFCCFLFFPFFECNAQQTISIRGVVIDELSKSVLTGVLVQFKSTGLKSFTNSKGEFLLKNISLGVYLLTMSLDGYSKKEFTIQVDEEVRIDLGTIYLFRKQEQFEDLQTIVLDDEDLLENDIGGATVITGLLQSSKDVFSRAAAFNFGPARFKIRGYDSAEGTVLFNGIKLNKVQTGRPQWSNWGGLNDVLRSGTFTNGLATTELGFGSLLGTNNFTTFASDYRPGTNFSLASTNGSYRGRIMASHFAGVVKNGWAFAFSLSSRFAQNGKTEGTTYKAYSAFFSVEKKLSDKHSLNFTSIYAFNRRGKSSANTQEVVDLKGVSYNSYWGIQNGENRNSRIQEIEEPLFVLNHQWKINSKSVLQTSLSYQFGHISASRLGYVNVPNPDPSYYKKLPSFYLQEEPNYSNAFLSQKNFIENGQINWYEMYEANSLTNTGSYYLFEDINEDQQFSFNTVFNKKIIENLKVDTGFSFRKLESLNYAKVLDVLGGMSFLDIDSFAEGDEQQSDLNNADRQVTVEDNFSYKYNVHFLELNGFVQSSYQLKKLELSMALNFSHTIYQREGLYRNGSYPENSFGKGTLLLFSDVSFKINGMYVFSGRHIFYGAFGLLSRAPTLKNVYGNIRLNNKSTPNISSEKTTTVDLNYQYRAPKIKARFTSYYTLFSDVTENSFLYAQGLRGDDADFIAQLVTGIQKQHFGFEFGMDLDLTSIISMSAVAALGQYTYYNNPNLYVDSDLYNAEESDFGTVYLEGYKLGGTPQRAYSLGFSYRDPNYWWVAINGNLLTHHYLSISPLLRSSNFYSDTDGVPFIDEDTGLQITKNQVSELLEQERFDDLFLLNLVGGKSWKINDNYVGLFLSLNNLLGAVYKTGGFEQSRKANYIKLKADKSLNTPLFGPKYWFQNGSSYYLILSYRF